MIYLESNRQYCLKVNYIGIKLHICKEYYVTLGKRRADLGEQLFKVFLAPELLLHRLYTLALKSTIRRKL